MTDRQFMFWVTNRNNKEKIESAMVKSGIDIESYNIAQSNKLTIDQLIEVINEYNDVINYLTDRTFGIDEDIEDLKKEQMFYETILADKILDEIDRA